MKDLDIKKNDLEEKAEVSHYTINKLNRGESITTDVLEKICNVLKCIADYIMEFVPDEVTK